jgi:hypothetical protein
MTVQAWRGRRIGVVLIAAGVLVLASAPAAFGVDRVYWGNGATDTISYANLDGSGGGGELGTSGAMPDEPRGVVIDSAAGRIYWANQNSATISYANLDGSGNGGELNTSGATITKPHGLAIDPAAGRIYWADSGNTISYANLDGSGGGGELDITGSTPNEPHGLVIDFASGRIFWTNLNSTISYAKIDGSGGGGELNLTGATERGGVGLGIDPTTGRIYWGNLGSNANAISYVNVDGSGGGGLLDISGASANQARFPALLRAPSAAAAPQVAGGSGPGSVLTCSQGSWAPDVLGSFFYRAPQSIAHQWTRDGAKIAGATDTSYTAYASGEYRCRETATNEAGSTSQTSAPLTVWGPPDTKLTQAKMNPSHHRAKFKFEGMGEVQAFYCKLERPRHAAPLTSCHSPQTYKHLQPGRYLFKVLAVGPGGPDPTPVEKRLTIP